MKQSFEFARLMASRLCHDLVSPLSAVNNGLEIFEEETDPEMKQRALDLLRTSLKVASDRVCCFRMAWGTALSMPSFFTAEMLDELLSPVLKQQKISLSMNLSEAVEKQQGQAFLCMGLVIAETLHRGGEILFDLNEQGDYRAVGKACRVRLSEEQRQFLLVDTSEFLEAKAISPVFLRLLCEEMGYNIELDYQQDDFLRLTLKSLLKPESGQSYVGV